MESLRSSKTTIRRSLLLHDARTFRRRALDKFHGAEIIVRKNHLSITGLASSHDISKSLPVKGGRLRKVTCNLSCVRVHTSRHQLIVRLSPVIAAPNPSQNLLIALIYSQNVPHSSSHGRVCLSDVFEPAIIVN